MQTLPAPPRSGDPVSASWMRRLLCCVRENRLIAGKGVALTRTPDGTIVNASASSRGGAIGETHPFFVKWDDYSSAFVIFLPAGSLIYNGGDMIPDAVKNGDLEAARDELGEDWYAIKEGENENAATGASGSTASGNSGSTTSGNSGSTTSGNSGSTTSGKDGKPGQITCTVTEARSASADSGDTSGEDSGDTSADSGDTSGEDSGDTSGEDSGDTSADSDTPSPGKHVYIRWGTYKAQSNETVLASFPVAKVAKVEKKAAGNGGEKTPDTYYVTRQLTRSQVYLRATTLAEWVDPGDEKDFEE